MDYVWRRRGAENVVNRELAAQLGSPESIHLNAHLLDAHMVAATGQIAP